MPVGNTDTPCRCQLVAPLLLAPRSLTARPPLLLLFPGRGPRQSAACCGGHTDTDKTDTAGLLGVATAPLERSSHLQGPKSIIAMTPATPDRWLQFPVAFPLIMLRCRTGEEFRRPRVGPGQGGVGNRNRILQSGPLPTSWSQLPRVRRARASLRSPSSSWR